MILNSFQDIYSDYECQVFHKGDLTEAFKVNIGVGQCGILSPKIFLVAVDDIMRRIAHNKEENQIGFARTVRGSGTQRLCLPAVTELRRHVREYRYPTGRSCHSCIKINCKKTNELGMNSNITRL